MAKEAGFEGVEVALAEDGEINLTSTKADMEQLEVASWLGCETILVVPGAVSVNFAPELGVVDYERAYERSLEALRELSGDAERLGITIGIENVWNDFLLSPLELRDFLYKIGSPFVGSYLDVGNVLYAGYPEQWSESRRYILRITGVRRGAWTGSWTSWQGM